MMRSPVAERGWSISRFERERVDLTNFLKREICPLLDSDECRRVLIEAPVKSGKRQMCEYLAMRDMAHSSGREHAFISALHRKADEMQRNELKLHNLTVFSLNTKKEVDKCIAWIQTNIARGKEVILHIDECDFGSGTRQMLSKIYALARNNERATTIMYSATPQEVLFSGEVPKPDAEDEEYQEMMDEMIHTGEKVLYVPPATFCGPARFLDAGLVMDATPFFHKDGANGLSLSAQGRQIIADLKESCAQGRGRNILLIRLSYSDNDNNKKDSKAIYQFINGLYAIPELADCAKLVDDDKADSYSGPKCSMLFQKIDWSDKEYWDEKQTTKPIIVVIDQRCSRSTELACHDRLFAIHDYRNKVTFSTLSQAVERVNHYSDRYGGEFQPIRVYTHKKTLELSARRISYDDYLMAPEWEAKKVDVRNGLGDVFNIRRSSGSHENHPTYPVPLTKEQSVRALQEIYCLSKVDLSKRVIGGITHTKEYAAEFKPCDKTTFATVKAELDVRFTKNFQNPFVHSEAAGLENGRWKGQLRGWRVLEFADDIKPKPGCGTEAGPRVTICYDNGVLGVSVRYATGRMTEKNTLVTCKSIYKK